jgi:hypothetical protein
MFKTQEEINKKYSEICLSIGDLTSRIQAYHRKKSELELEAFSLIDLKPTGETDGQENAQEKA